jgi:glycerol uptake facilitator-like aquaporin
MAATSVDDVFTVRALQVASAEFTGTFFLAFFISSNSVSGVAAPYAIGFGLIAMIYIFAGISGAQFNPAMSIGLLLTGNLSVVEALYCIVSQILGALFAGLVGWGLYGDNWSDVGYPEVHDKNKRPQAFVAEMVLTFALIWSVLNFANNKLIAHNSFYGMTFGLLVTAGALVIATISGACFNPAVSMLTLLHGAYNDMWVFFLGPIIGSVLASAVFRLQPYLDVLYRKLIAEFIGSFYIAWVVALTSNSDNSGGFLALGFMTASMVYTSRHLSGGYLNPSVTLGVYIRGLFERPQVLQLWECGLYMAVQTVAAFCAAGVAAFVNSGTQNIAYPEVDSAFYTDNASLIIQAMFSFALVLTVLHTATNSSYIKHDDYFGIAIGFVTIGCSLSYGDIAGGALNPAIAGSLMLVTNHHTSQFWIYIVGDFVGAIAAAGMYYIWWGTYGQNRVGQRVVQELPYSRNYSHDEGETKYHNVDYASPAALLADSRNNVYNPVSSSF